MKISEDQVFEVIERTGTAGISKQDLTKKLGGDPAYRAEQLIKAGLITKQRDGMTTRYYVKPKIAKVDVPLPKVSPPALMSTNLFKPKEYLKPEMDADIEVARALKREVVVQKSELDKLVNEFVAALATSVVERLRPMLVEKLSSSVAVMTAEISNNVANVPEKVKLPSILVGGLHPDQTHMIETEFKGVADIRFVGADESNSVWKSRASNACHTVLVVDFLSHKHIESVKATGVTPIILRGGLTKLRDKLMELSV